MSPCVIIFLPPNSSSLQGRIPWCLIAWHRAEQPGAHKCSSNEGAPEDRCHTSTAWAAGGQAPWALCGSLLWWWCSAGRGLGDLDRHTSLPVTEKPHSQVDWYSLRHVAEQPCPLFPGIHGPVKSMGPREPLSPSRRLVLAGVGGLSWSHPSPEARAAWDP